MTELHLWECGVVLLFAVLLYFLFYARATPGFYGQRKERRKDERLAFFISLLNLGERERNAERWKR